jgi:UDP-N-acetyl-D-mannosaminuronic acid dehydrogenase
VAKSDILVVLVDHREFKRLKSAELKEKVVIDTRGIL